MCPSFSLPACTLKLTIDTPPLQIPFLQARLADVLGLAANKQKISREGVGVVRDGFSLAFYNVDPSVTLSLDIARRGGRGGGKK